MAYRPIDRSSSGIVFFGSATTDQTFESNSNFRIDTANSRAILSNITVADGGKIGSASRTGILTLGSDGIATFASGVVIDGNLTVNGTTTTVNTETIELSDNIIVLNSNFTAGVPTENAGLEIKRGSSTNVVFRWNETSDFWDFTNDGSTYFEIASRTGNQTLLNKTIDGNNNTLQNIGNASLTNSSLTVAAGSGLINGGTVSLGGTITLDIGRGNGITVANDAISVTKGSGIIVDANGVHVNVNPSVLSIATDQVTIATSGVNNTHLNSNVISSQQILSGSIDVSNDYILVYDDSASSLRKINRTNFLNGISTSFNISDGTNTQTIDSTNTLLFQSGPAINFTVSPTDTVSGTLNSSVAGNGLVMANQVLSIGAGNGISVAADSISVVAGSGLSVDSNGVHIDLSEYVTPVAVASGDSFLMLDSDGATEQRSTITQLGSYLAGTNVTAGGDGKLSVTDTTLEGVIFTSDNFVDSSTVDFTVTAGQSVTAIVINDSIDNSKLRNSAGLSVIGRSANTTGDPADIVASTDGHVLRLSGTTLGFGTIATAGIADGAVTEIKRSRTVASVSTTSTLSSDINLCTAGAGGITVTLPAVASGKKIIIKKIDSGAGTVTIQRGGSSTIDGANTIQLYYQYEAVTLVSDGTNWFIT